MSDPAHWERVRARFHDLLERPAEEQAAGIRLMAADDAPLAHEVASLLDALRAAGEARFADSGPLDAARVTGTVTSGAEVSSSGVSDTDSRDMSNRAANPEDLASPASASRAASDANVTNEANEANTSNTANTDSDSAPAVNRGGDLAAGVTDAARPASIANIANAASAASAVHRPSPTPRSDSIDLPFDEQPAPSLPRLRAGDRLGVFEILGPAGRGGMGEVYKARDLRLDRLVAIKVVAGRRGGDPRARERFEREARAISRLSHPHICTLHDVGSATAAGEPDVPFLVMEFLEGRTLADRLTDGRLPPHDALRYAIAIVDALAAAHAQGIVHRDLKPANVMLTEGGVKLLDFGLAQLRASAVAVARGGPAFSAQSSLSAHGFILGTLRYMSPEQLRGEPTDHRCDIFACGVVLHEMLAGRAPFDARDDASVIAAVLTGEPPALILRDARLAQLCTRIIRRCLEKQPDRRWSRMESLRVALCDALDACQPAPAGQARELVASVAQIARSSALAFLDAHAGRAHAPHAAADAHQPNGGHGANGPGRANDVNDVSDANGRHGVHRDRRASGDGRGNGMSASPGGAVGRRADGALASGDHDGDDTYGHDAGEGYGVDTRYDHVRADDRHSADRHAADRHVTHGRVADGLAVDRHAADRHSTDHNAADRHAGARSAAARSAGARNVATRNASARDAAARKVDASVENDRDAADRDVDGRNAGDRVAHAIYAARAAQVPHAAQAADAAREARDGHVAAARGHNRSGAPASSFAVRLLLALFSLLVAIGTTGLRVLRVVTSWRVVRAAVGLLVTVAACIALFHLLRAPNPAASQISAVRVAIIPPEGVRFEVVQISPDGRRIAFTGWTPEGPRLWLRALDAPEARIVAGTLGAHGPLIWSPDSRLLAFMLNGRLLALDTVAGGTRTIAEIGRPLTGTWSADDVILFDAGKSTREGLWRVQANGLGAPTQVRRPDPARGESSFLFPHFLPDGKHFLYAVQSADPQRAGVFLGSLKDDKRQRVLERPSPAIYVASGHLLFLRDDAVIAQGFDPDRGTLRGEPMVIVPAPATLDRWRRLFASDGGTVTLFSASQTGTIVHSANTPDAEQLAWHDRDGRRLQAIGEPGSYAGFSLSRDDTRVVATRTDGERLPWNLWMLDLARGTSTRMTFAEHDQFDPRWAPDGRHLVVSVATTPRGSNGMDSDLPVTNVGPKALAAIALDGRERTLYHDPARSLSIDDWSPDGSTLLYHVDRDRELLAVPVTGEQRPRVIWKSPSASAPDQARFSPDGRWVAYHAQESGRPEVYVTRYPEGGERWQISTAGGVQPMWRSDGRELFFLGLDARMFAVSLGPRGRFEPETPRPLFQTTIGPSPYTEQYAVDRAGERFLLLEPDPRAAAPVIDVVLNWTAARQTALVP